MKTIISLFIRVIVVLLLISLGAYTINIELYIVTSLSLVAATILAITVSRDIEYCIKNN